MLVTAVSMTENVIFNGHVQMSRTIDTAPESVNASPSLRFERAIPPNGYAWWYCDALSDDGEHGITIIAMLGSVFSPHYFRARARGATDPLSHCAFNAVLYGRRGRHWSMTEYGARDVRRAPDSLHIAANAVLHRGDSIVIRVDDRTAPWGRPLRGEIVVTPTGWGSRDYALEPTEAHRWWPIAPQCTVMVDFAVPTVRWSGRGYFDSNWGARPLEHDFASWNWSRVSAAQETVVFYDVVPRAAPNVSLALAVSPAGSVRSITPPPIVQLPRTGWGLPRAVRADHPHSATVLATLESAPFYARSAIAMEVLGQRVQGIHESLSLDRFRRAWVQTLLPVRAPRGGD